MFSFGDSTTFQVLKIKYDSHWKSMKLDDFAIVSSDSPHDTPIQKKKLEKDKPAGNTQIFTRLKL